MAVFLLRPTALMPGCGRWIPISLTYGQVSAHTRSKEIRLIKMRASFSEGLIFCKRSIELCKKFDKSEKNP
jgi:hypothetical protein